MAKKFMEVAKAEGLQVNEVISANIVYLISWRALLYLILWAMRVHIFLESLISVSQFFVNSY